MLKKNSAFQPSQPKPLPPRGLEYLSMDPKPGSFPMPTRWGIPINHPNRSSSLLMNPSPTWNTLSGNYDGLKKGDLHISTM